MIQHICKRKVKCIQSVYWIFIFILLISAPTSSQWNDRSSSPETLPSDMYVRILLNFQFRSKKISSNFTISFPLDNVLCKSDIVMISNVDLIYFSSILNLKLWISIWKILIIFVSPTKRKDFMAAVRNSSLAFVKIIHCFIREVYVSCLVDRMEGRCVLNWQERWYFICH